MLKVQDERSAASTGKQYYWNDLIYSRNIRNHQVE